MSDRRGFALLAVMLVMALLGVVAAEFAFTMRLEASMVRAHRDSLLALHLAEAAVHQAIREILSGAQVHGLDEHGQLVFYRTGVGQTIPTRLPMLPRERVALPAGEFSYRISDEEARINLNAAAPDRLDRLLTGLEVERRQREIIIDSLADWRDPNDAHRINGAESEDYYLKLPLPYRARNADLRDPSELLQVRGVTLEMFHGRPATERGEAQPGLRDHVTTFGRNLININTAPPTVLRAANLSEAEITDIVQGRERTPYPFVPGRYAGRGLAVGTQTFRVEAVGLIGGEPRARLVVILQPSRRSSGAAPAPSAGPAAPSTGVTILSWRLGGDLDLPLPGRGR